MSPLIRQRVLALGFCLLSFSKSVLAQEQAAASESQINDAYQKAADGLKQYKAGHYAQALDDYTRAYSIVHLPALAVHIARANIKLGRFVAAKQFYDEALSLADGLGDPQVQARARDEARAEGQSLLVRIPRLLFHTSGVSVNSVTIRVDGAIVPPAAYGAGWFVDPGSHQVLANSGTQEQRRWVAVSEGEARDLTFTFIAERANAGSTPQARNVTHAAEKPSTAVRTAAWVSMGLGGAGLFVWGTTGLVALRKSNHLDALGCGGTGEPCPASERDSYNHWKTASTVGFYTGAAAVLTGVTLYFVAPREKKARDATGRVIPLLGIGSAGVEGHF